MVRRLGAALALVLIVLPAWAADAVQNAVPEEVWDRPRSGSTLLGVPAIERTLAALAADPQARLVIRHAPGNEFVGQAEELKAWLVAHAIAPERISLLPDLSARQPIRLNVSAPAKPGGQT
jgi:hypothetical protein